MWWMFFALQALDLGTTLAGFRLGADEANPFIRQLMTFGPTTGVVLAKGIAVALAFLSLWLGRRRVILYVNCWFVGICTWNLGVIAVALAAR
jgi:hypothetical protein